MVLTQHTPSTPQRVAQISDDPPALQTGTRAAHECVVMAGAFRVLLWALVLLAPGGILLAPVLAAHELRRRSARSQGGGAIQLGAPELALARVSHVPSRL